MKNNIYKITLHSLVQLITNSSTVIYTYSEGAIETAKNLINEFLKLQGSDLKADDLFYIDTFLESTYEYEIPDTENADIDEIINLVLTKQMDRPKWMIEAEDGQNWSGYNKETSLYIKAKDENYSDLANAMLKFLYSTNHEACYDG